MAMIDFDMMMDDGKSIDAFHNIIEARQKELGETSKNSCIAVAINILKSLRTETKVAKTNDKADISIKCIDDKYYPSWKTVGKKRLSCLRAGYKGNEVNVSKVVWLSNGYIQGRILHCYEVSDNIADDKIVKAIVVAPNENIAIKWMKQKHKNRIKHRKGLAKLALGLAMHEVSSDENVSDNVEELVRKVASLKTEASITQNADYVLVHVRDKLDYAQDALKDGESSISKATMSTLNKMTAYIIHRLHQKGISTNMKIPYPELKKAL